MSDNAFSQSHPARLENENEPLIGNTLTAEDDACPTETSSVDQEPKSSLHFLMVSLAIGGLQVVWSVQHSSASPYLLSLGLSKALLAFTWLAGPLTGTFVQPYIGIRSDNCSTRWGKRKPFMVAGGAGTIVCLLALAWIREIVGIFSGWSTEETQSGTKVAIIILAMVLIYCLDFAINTVQTATRAFIVDNAPWQQQKLANAWASRISGAGNILGYCLGFLDLPTMFPFLGNTQFKVLCVVASVSLMTTLIISCTFTEEMNRAEEPPTRDPTATMPSIRLILRSIGQLSSQTRKVFSVQLASWFGWFPFLFFSTTYMGQLYVDPIFDKHPDMSDDDIDKTWAYATRISTFALFVNALISFTANIMLPLLIRPAQEEEMEATKSTPTSSYSWQTLPSRCLQKLWIPGLTLRRMWLLSHYAFAACMFSTFFISSTQGASVMVGILGVSWAITAWVPYALIATDIARFTAEKRQRQCPPVFDENREQRISQPQDPSLESGQDGSGQTGQAGIVLGIHNVFISFPQIISGAVSSLIFKMLQKPRGEPYDTSVAWVMRLGGCAALVAAFLTISLQERFQR
ncbi:putative sucrose transporter [Aspergillus campestris IBT 28561]|uniref:Sucrose transporter n=1 Tax=Aspergillus campestris (strain IBT 28561) TaxID=1392248 RepID=A0A2I1CTP9_ASPC2|nr:putative sucrose transporter [Aspergillus campestris IBT 28561]PKY00998.1 putative sucrose transporter [Aspergillus campestris IBT 28561]